MNLIAAILFRIKKQYNSLYCYLQRLRLKNKTFCIISSNCWGGSVYEDLRLPYNTPTVGLFFYAPCYIEFLNQLEYYISCSLTFTDVSKYTEANEERKKHYYPIGKLNDLEIHFLHYKTEQEALEKWKRRCLRINLDNLFVAFTDRDKCTSLLATQFDNLPYKNKVLFTAQNRSMKSAVVLRKFTGKSVIGDIYSDRWSYRKDFDVVGWLNGKCFQKSEVRA